MSNIQITIQLTDYQLKAFNNGESVTIRPPPKKEKWEPKEVWKSKLFENCPIMASTLVKDSDWEMFNYEGELNFYKFEEMHRLPTIEESPRNVWLCPHDEKPEGFNDVQIMLRNKSNNTWDYDRAYGEDYNSSEITAFMILEDLK